MTHMISCQKLGKTAEGLSQPPFPGAKGQQIYDAISQAAWDSWLTQQTMLINEYRLDLLDTEAQSFLEKEMDKFLGFAEQT